MDRKLCLLLVLLVTCLSTSCGPRDDSLAGTAVPSPSIPPTQQPVPSVVPAGTQTPSVPGQGVLMTIGQHGSGEGEFIDPRGLALDQQGNIYVADTGNARVQVFDPQGSLLLVLYDQRFMGPRSVALDDAGRIYVTDRAERVHVFSTTGQALQSFGQPGPLPSQFSDVADLALDEAGDLYVVDGGNSRVQKFSLLGGLLFTFGDEGESAELLSRPVGIALDAQGNVYVGDAANNSVQKYAPGGTFLRSFGVQGGELRDIAIDSVGNIYVSVAERDLIQVLDSRGQPQLELGEGLLDDPWGVAVDGDGRVFVVDAGNDRILAFAPLQEAASPSPTGIAGASPTPALPPMEGPAPWPMYGGNAQHTGHSFAAGPQAPKLKWMFRAGILVNSPVVGADASIYFGSLDGNLYALSSDGTLAWRAAIGQISGVPAVSEDGAVYVGVASPVEEMFHAFGHDGSPGWQYNIESHIVESSPVIGPDGTIYLAGSIPQSATGAVIALTAEGTELWRYDVGSRIPFSPALGPAGTVYAGARNGILYALNADGTLKWQANLGAVSSTAVVGADGTIYLGTGSSYQALNPADGSQIWVFRPLDSEADSTPTLGRGGRIHLTSNSNELYALAPDGTPVWTFTAEEAEEKEVHFSSPITLDSDRVLYAGTREGELFAVNPDGTLRWRFALSDGGMVLVGPAIGNDGTLYVGAGGNLYAVGD